MAKPVERITELGALINALYIDPSDGRKRFASVRYIEVSKECLVTEVFDDGHGHSGSLTNKVTPVDLTLFNEACRRDFLSWRLAKDSTHQMEFFLTENQDTRQEAFRILNEWKKRQPGEHIVEPEVLIDELYTDEADRITEKELRLLGLDYEDYRNLVAIRNHISAPTKVKTLQRILRFVRSALDANPDLRSKI